MEQSNIKKILNTLFTIVVRVPGAGINSEINKLTQILIVGGSTFNSKGNQIVYVHFAIF